MNGVACLALSALLLGASGCTFVVSSLVDDAPDTALDADDDEIRQDIDANPGSNLGAPCAIHADCEMGERTGYCIPDRQGWPGGYCSFYCVTGSDDQCERMGGTCINALNYWPLSAEADLCVLRCTGEEDCRLPDYGCRNLCPDESGSACTPPICAPTVVGSPCSVDAVEDHCHWGGAEGSRVRCLRDLEVDILLNFNGGYCSAECGLEPESCGPNAACVMIDVGVFQRELCLDRCSVDVGDECRWNYSCRNTIGPTIVLDGHYCLPDMVDLPQP